MDADDLARGRALEAELPIGEWGIHNRGAGPGGGYAVERGIITPEAVALVLDADTARFIAWARNAMPSLLDAAERAARLEAALEQIVGIGMRPTFDAAAESERITAIARAALERPKGDGDGR